MIEYEQAYWACWLAFRLRGSVFPRSLSCAVPSAAIAAVVHITCEVWDIQLNHDATAQTQIVSVFSFVLGFLLVFRTQIAYSRFWDGASHLQTIRGGWFNVVSSCFAFCTPKTEKAPEVQVFQHQIVRLMSMLYCATLQQVCEMRERTFEIIDFKGMDPDRICWMQTRPDKCEIILQWIQRLIVDNHHSGVISIAPPILSRVFQELANGIIDVSNARRIKMFPFPFPYAQMISIMLMIHWVVQTIGAGLMMGTWYSAAVLAFVSTLTFWSINYIAIELEMPYGSDDNDLPLAEMQRIMNRSLVTLLKPEAQHPPAFAFNDTEHTMCVIRAWHVDEMDRRHSQNEKTGSFDSSTYGTKILQPVAVPEPTKGSISQLSQPDGQTWQQLQPLQPLQAMQTLQPVPALQPLQPGQIVAQQQQQHAQQQLQQLQQLQPPQLINGHHENAPAAAHPGAPPLVSAKGLVAAPVAPVAGAALCDASPVATVLAPVDAGTAAGNWQPGHICGSTGGSGLGSYAPPPILDSEATLAEHEPLAQQQRQQQQARATPSEVPLAVSSRSPSRVSAPAADLASDAAQNCALRADIVDGIATQMERHCGGIIAELRKLTELGHRNLAHLKHMSDALARGNGADKGTLKAVKWTTGSSKDAAGRWATGDEDMAPVHPPSSSLLHPPSSSIEPQRL